MSQGMVSAFDTTYRIEGTTPPNRCFDCHQQTNKLVGRMAHRGFRKPRANAPAGIIYCVGCHATKPIFPQILEAVIADAATPWRVDDMVASPEGREALAEGWMDEAWGDDAQDRLDASGLSDLDQLRQVMVWLAEAASERFGLGAKDAWWLVVVLEFDPADPHKVAPV